MHLSPWKSSSSAPVINSKTRDDFKSFHNEMNQLMNTFFNRNEISLPQSMDSTIFPTIDIKEKDNKYLLDADVPGMAEEDLTIDLKNNTLILKGEKKSEMESHDSDFVCIERSYGSFRREIPFDEEIDQENIKAELKDGVLHVELNKKEKSKSNHKKIPIKH